jgi:hypothetical protein
MLHARPLALASLTILLLHGGCASNPHAAATQEHAVSAGAFDPLGGDYPQIMWMCHVYEVPARTEIAPDGTVRASTSDRPNGIGLVEAIHAERAFASIRQLPNAMNLGTPLAFSPPKSAARVGAGSRDKSGASIGERSLTMTGELVGDQVRSTVEIETTCGSSSVSCNSGTPEVPSGGALLFLCPGPDPHEPWTLLVVRPTILRSNADFPYQRASSAATPEVR